MVTEMDRPTCPACFSSRFVHRAGLIERRKRSGMIQNYRCSKCKRRFRDPAAPRIAFGKRPNLALKARALLLRRRGLTFARIGKALGFSKARARYLCCYAANPTAPAPMRVTARFEVCIRPSLLQSLQDMFRAANTGRTGEDTLSLSTFISEVVECQIIDFRAKQKNIRDLLPLSPAPVPPIPPRLAYEHQLSPRDVEKMRSLLRSGELKIGAVAERFGVAQSTIWRELNHANGN
jgi:transposase-like protein